MDVCFENSWDTILFEEIKKEYFTSLLGQMEQAYATQKVWPKKEHLFRVFKTIPLESIKVVILGQDPYPSAGHANGMAFSVESNVSPLPKSLFNIFKELKEDLNNDPPDHGDLSEWGSQGVFLLNTCLSVHEGEPNSHKGWGWEKFTDFVITAISHNRKNIVFILWGKQAQSKASLIDANKHEILTSAHPSPLSAYRGFFGSKPFSKANDYLTSHKIKPIHW